MSKTGVVSSRELAELCLAHLAQDPALLGEFLVSSGYTPTGLRESLGTDELDRGLIDYFAQNEPLLMALCAASGRSPESFMRVWARLNAAA